MLVKSWTADCFKRGFRPLRVILVSSLAVPRQPICTQAVRGLSTSIIVCKRIMHFLEQASPPSVIVLFPCGFRHPDGYLRAVWVLDTEPLITVSVVWYGENTGESVIYARWWSAVSGVLCSPLAMHAYMRRSEG